MTAERVLARVRLAASNVRAKKWAGIGADVLMERIDTELDARATQGADQAEKMLVKKKNSPAAELLLEFSHWVERLQRNCRRVGTIPFLEVKQPVRLRCWELLRQIPSLDSRCKLLGVEASGGRGCVNHCVVEVEVVHVVERCRGCVVRDDGVVLES